MNLGLRKKEEILLLLYFVRPGDGIANPYRFVRTCKSSHRNDFLELEFVELVIPHIGSQAQMKFQTKRCQHGLRLYSSMDEDSILPFFCSRQGRNACKIMFCFYGSMKEHVKDVKGYLIDEGAYPLVLIWDTKQNS